MKDKSEQNQNFAKKKNHILRNLFIVSGILVFIAALVCLTIFLIKNYNNNRITLKTIRQSWSEYNYEKVYEQGKTFLQDKPYNNTALTYYGYACFYLAVSQNDTFTAQEYLDESINTLRMAMYDASKSLLPQLQYMLGKAYFYKNTITTYYYADLAIKYLTLARENGYKADDISEYLGLSYAALGKTYESISAFTEALIVRESDSLLLSIAEQYYKADLRIRPIYHRLRNRIEGHICIYTILLELERRLKKAKTPISLNQAKEMTNNIYSITYTLPETKQKRERLYCRCRTNRNYSSK